MAVEVSLFKLVSGVTPDAFQQAAREATRQLQQFDGFRSRELFHDPESGQWTEVLRWESREHAVRVSSQVLQMNELKPFIEKIDPSTILMYHGEEVDVEELNDPADNTPINRLRNIAPASARMLESIGIVNLSDLERVGPVLAFRALKDIRSGARLNLLWAMHGALTGERWDLLSDETRERLKLELEEALQIPPGRE